MSTLALAVVEELRAGPAFVMPCPACSFVDVADFPDTIRTPSIVWRPRIGCFALAGVSGACGLCREPLKGETPAAVAAAWHARIAAWAFDAKQPNARKIARTLQRLAARGLAVEGIPLLAPAP